MERNQPHGDPADPHSAGENLRMCHLTFFLHARICICISVSNPNIDIHPGLHPRGLGVSAAIDKDVMAVAGRRCVRDVSMRLEAFSIRSALPE
jgi:hypothetical protein